MRAGGAKLGVLLSHVVLKLEHRQLRPLSSTAARSPARTRSRLTATTVEKESDSRGPASC